MAELRNAARGLAVSDPDPAAIVQALRGLVSLDGDRELLATAAYAVLDPATGVGTWASAGHPAPVLLGRSGSVTPLAIEPGPPLGSPAHANAGVPLLVRRAGDTVVWFTDGVIE